jgi:hypothetical protein
MDFPCRSACNRFLQMLSLSREGPRVSIQTGWRQGLDRYPSDMSPLLVSEISGKSCSCSVPRCGSVLVIVIEFVLSLVISGGRHGGRNPERLLSAYG